MARAFCIARQERIKKEDSRLEPGFMDQYSCSVQNGQNFGVFGSPERSFPQYGHAL